MSTSMTRAPGGPNRLGRAERRAQLLDAAAGLVVERGAGALTMERLADQAGVSKALPYRHFANAHEVLRALYEREVLDLGRRVVEARRGVSDPRVRLRRSVETYFDVVGRRRGVLRVLAASGVVDEHARSVEGRDVALEFVASLFEADTDLNGTSARAAATVLSGALNGATTAWAERRATRGQLVDAVVAIVVSLTASFAPASTRDRSVADES